MKSYQRRYINTLRYATPVVLLFLGWCIMFVSYPLGRSFLAILHISATKTGY